MPQLNKALRREMSVLNNDPIRVHGSHRIRDLVQATSHVKETPALIYQVLYDRRLADARLADDGNVARSLRKFLQEGFAPQQFDVYRGASRQRIRRKRAETISQTQKICSAFAIPVQ